MKMMFATLLPNSRGQPVARTEHMYSVVIPVYRNEDEIRPLVEALKQTLPNVRVPVEVIFVIDGLVDKSYNRLKDCLPAAEFETQILILSRNFGAFSAIRAGLEAAKGDRVAVISADLQEPPEILVRFFEELNDQNIDLAIGSRISREDPLRSRLFSSIFWFFYTKFVNKEIPRNGVDVFACKRPVIDAMESMQEGNTSLIGLIFWIGFNRKYVTYSRSKRVIGKSSWTFRKKYKYLSDSIFAFTDLPIVALQLIGFLGTFFSFILGTFAFLGSVLGKIHTPGYTTLVIVILGSTSSILWGLGIVGSYAWRAFENTKRRPNYLIMRREVSNG